MRLLHLWSLGYLNPERLVEELCDAPAPAAGFSAQLLRALLDSLLLYLPLWLLGRVPPTPSYLPAIATGHYYGALIWLAPLVLTAQWLLGGASVHVVLRLCHRRSDIDQILNISGMAALVVGGFLLVWDWSWLLIGGMNQYTLGISHLILDGWGVLITVLGLKRVLGVPIWLGLLLNVLLMLVALPPAIMFMRAPL